MENYMKTETVTYRERPAGDVLRIFLLEIKFEFLKLIRNRAFSLSTIGFPVMFYVLFGVVDKHTMYGHMDIAKYLLGSYACFGLMGASLFGVGAGMAAERAAGWLELKRASPMPPLAYLVAKAATAVAFALIITSVLCGVGVEFGGVKLSGAELGHMLAIAGVGAIPFSAMGMLLGLTMPSAAASGIVNMIYLPLSFCSGLWVPIFLLPKVLQKVAVYSPVYHLAQLMENGFGYANGPNMSGHWMALAGFLMVMLGASWAVFQRAEQNA
jgi:ABC-2 type transport system permease protein